MEQIEIFNENIVLIIKHGDKLIPEERIKYYEAVIHELYVVRSAFKRDLYMEETSIKKQLEKELEKTKQEIDREEMNSDIIRIRTTLSVSDLARIFESLLMTKLISEKTEIKQTKIQKTRSVLMLGTQKKSSYSLSFMRLVEL